MLILTYREIKSLLFPDVSSQIDVEPAIEILVPDSFNRVKEITPYPDYRKRFVISDTTTEIDIALVNIVRFGPDLHSCSINKWEVGHNLDGNFIISSTGKYVAFLFTSYFPMKSNQTVIYDIAAHRYAQLHLQADELCSFSSENTLAYVRRGSQNKLLVSDVDDWSDCK